MDRQNINPMEEEERDETAAMICGYEHPCHKPLGKCWHCGGDVWPIEDECWDGEKFHYITFMYECRQCGRTDVSDQLIRREKP